VSVNLTDGEGWVDGLMCRNLRPLLLKRLDVDGQSTVAKKRLVALKEIWQESNTDFMGIIFRSSGGELNVFENAGILCKALRVPGNS
jgi:hypothetical protein